MTSTKSNLSSFFFFPCSSSSSKFYFVIAISILFLQFPSILAVRSKNPPSKTNSTDFIRTSCNATLYPDLCYSSLCNYSNSVQRNPTQLACVAIKISLSNTRKMCTYISKLSKGTTPDPRTSGALHDCRSTFNSAVYHMKRSLKQMYELNDGSGSFRFLMSNVQTWMSAALSNEETCMDGFQEVNGGTMKADVCNRTLMLKKYTSNALALINTCAAQGANN